MEEASIERRAALLVKTVPNTTRRPFDQVSDSLDERGISGQADSRATGPRFVTEDARFQPACCIARPAQSLRQFSLELIAIGVIPMPFSQPTIGVQHQPRQVVWADLCRAARAQPQALVQVADIRPGSRAQLVAHPLTQAQHDDALARPRPLNRRTEIAIEAAEENHVGAIGRTAAAGEQKVYVASQPHVGGVLAAQADLIERSHAEFFQLVLQIAAALLA